MIAKALAWERFGVRLGNGYSAIASVFQQRRPGTLWTDAFPCEVSRIGGFGRRHVQIRGRARAEYPELTLWRFEIYGGIDFGGDPNVHGPSSLAIAVTGVRKQSGIFSTAVFLKDRNAPKVGRNDPCPCGSGTKHKKCHGSVAKIEARDRALAAAAARRVVPSTYQPLAAHGYGPQQTEEIQRYIQQMRSAR